MRHETKFIGFAVAAMGLASSALAAPREIDARRLAAAGVRVLDGKYVRVLTDLPSSAAVDELPAVFDAAVPQWVEYFHVPAAKLAGARWQAYVIQDRALFAALELMPKENPEFKSGFATDWELWLVEQPSDYYRRHLLLHEGTHAFMQSQLGGCGPGWYMEGTAELLGTHSWREGRLKLGVFPANKEDVPMWGRIKLVRDAAAKGEAWSLERVLETDNSREMSTDQYAWAWALAAMLDGNPMFRDRFRGLRSGVTKSKTEFNGLFQAMVMLDSDVLHWEWQTFIDQLDYGYDIPKMAITIASVNVADGRKQVRVRADRGWQLAAGDLKAGKTYRLTATGRYLIAGGAEPWQCEPGGVTLEYHDGRPLGALLGALASADADDPSFARPMLIGLDATLTPKRDGWLFVRVNDSPAKLGDNQGELKLHVEEATHIAPGQ